MNTIFLLIVFLPLLGAILAGVFGTALLKGTQDHAAHAHHDDDHHHDHGPSWPMYLTTVFLMISAVLSWFAFFDVAINEQTYKVHVLDFIRSGGMAADWAFRVDTLTSVMLVVVTTVSALVHMYSHRLHERRSGRSASSATCRCSPSPC
jgi:NADH-quinone oxidoreductase subunit L